MHVRVHEGGQRVETLGVHHLGVVRGLEALAHLGHLAVAHEQVGHAVEAGARIEEHGAPQEQGGRHHGGPVEHQLGHAGCGVVVAGTRASAGAPGPVSSS